MHVYSTTEPAQPDDFPSLHPVLRPMRAACERLFERGDYERAFPILGALAVLNGKPSFLRGSAHEHFAGDEVGRVKHV